MGGQLHEGCINAFIIHFSFMSAWNYHGIPTTSLCSRIRICSLIKKKKKKKRNKLNSKALILSMELVLTHLFLFFAKSWRLQTKHSPIPFTLEAKPMGAGTKARRQCLRNRVKSSWTFVSSLHLKNHLSNNSTQRPSHLFTDSERSRPQCQICSHHYVLGYH